MSGKETQDGLPFYTSIKSDKPITEKQRIIIEVLEKEMKIDFKGNCFEEADEFIFELFQRKHSPWSEDCFHIRKAERIIIKKLNQLELRDSLNGFIEKIQHF